MWKKACKMRHSLQREELAIVRLPQSVKTDKEAVIWFVVLKNVRKQPRRNVLCHLI